MDICAVTWSLDLNVVLEEKKILFIPEKERERESLFLTPTRRVTRQVHRDKSKVRGQCRDRHSSQCNCIRCLTL